MKIPAQEKKQTHKRQGEGGRDPPANPKPKPDLTCHKPPDLQTFSKVSASPFFNGSRHVYASEKQSNEGITLCKWFTATSKVVYCFQ